MSAPLIEAFLFGAVALVCLMGLGVAAWSILYSRSQRATRAKLRNLGERLDDHIDLHAEPLPQGAGYQDEPTMTLTDFIAERTALEQYLCGHIRAATSAFTKRTGATVSAIEVGMIEVTRIGEPAERMVSSVRVVTPLD
jgi:hypothetical protein